tara:strand:- start:376 stop:1152 length:777 start_codon:yes stop_codon:yes gene_type:complete
MSIDEIDLDLRHDFNFLCVSQLGPRKNVDSVINNFIEEFKNEEVGLLLKVHGANDSVIDFHNLKNQFRQITQTAKEEGWKCSINLLHGNLTDEQMQGLYAHPKVKAMVSFTHGEGFGLPLYEAVWHGLPIIATDWSGHLDFLSLKEDINSPNKFKGGKTKGKITTMKKKFAAVKCELKEIPQQAVWNGVLQAGSKWAYVDENDARKKMRDVFNNEDKYSAMSDELRDSYKGEEYYYNKFNEELAINFEVNENEEVVTL